MIIENQKKTKDKDIFFQLDNQAGIIFKINKFFRTITRDKKRLNQVHKC